MAGLSLVTPGSLTDRLPIGHHSGMPALPATSVQIFGLTDSRPTRAALRFFKERRVAVQYVDLRRKPIAPGELRRFVERLGAEALLDTEGRRYRDLGLDHMRLDASEITTRLLADDALLRLPLVRFGNAFTAGPAEATWKTWLAAGKG
jgi:arsenate reductase